MKRCSHLFILVVLCLSVTGCGQVFDYKDQGFSLRLPRNWKFLETGSEYQEGHTTSGFLFETRKPLIPLFGGYRSARMFVIHNRNPLGRIKKAAMIDYNIGPFDQIGNIQERTFKDIDGQEAEYFLVHKNEAYLEKVETTKIGVNSEERLVPVVKQFYFIEKDEHNFYTIILSTNEEEYGHFKNVFEEIVESIRFH